MPGALSAVLRSGAEDRRHIESACNLALMHHFRLLYPHAEDLRERRGLSGAYLRTD
jgi:hypothetical protein